MSWHRGRKAWLFLLGAAILLLAAGALDPSGLAKSFLLQEECVRLSGENGRLQLENDRLAREARALLTDPKARERAAREELRFIRAGELIYRLDGRAAGSP
jgi:cell division protein FtsB